MSSAPSESPSRSAFVRRPSPKLANGLVTHVERSTDVDPVVAYEQWSGYVNALTDAGYEIHEVEPAPDCPDGVFIEDAMVIARDLMVVTAPGAAARCARDPWRQSCCGGPGSPCSRPGRCAR